MTMHSKKEYQSFKTPFLTMLLKHRSEKTISREITTTSVFDHLDILYSHLSASTYCMPFNTLWMRSCCSEVVDITFQTTFHFAPDIGRILLGFGFRTLAFGDEEVYTACGKRVRSWLCVWKCFDFLWWFGWDWFVGSGTGRRERSWRWKGCVWKGLVTAWSYWWGRGV